MKVTTLMENTACAERYAAEHGLSLFIETKKINILFDSGSSEAFADNAKKLGVDLGTADTLCGFDTVYYTGHCTGVAQYEFLKQKMGDRLHYISSGSVVEV